MKPHISLITLGVANVQKSTEFYQKLGFPVEPSDSITFIKTSGAWLSLFGQDDLAKDANIPNDKQGFSGITLAHNVLSKQQVDAIFAELRSLGVKITNEPNEKEWGGYSGYFEDPDGYLWEVAFNPYSPEIAINYE